MKFKKMKRVAVMVSTRSLFKAAKTKQFLLSFQCSVFSVFVQDWNTYKSCNFACYKAKESVDSI